MCLCQDKTPVGYGGCSWMHSVSPEHTQQGEGWFYCLLNQILLLSAWETRGYLCTDAVDKPPVAELRALTHSPFSLLVTSLHF